jgi:hypothetical protein
MLLMLEAEGDPKGASVNMELLRTGVPQSVFLKSLDGTLSGIAPVTVWGYQFGMSCHSL